MKQYLPLFFLSFFLVPVKAQLPVAATTAGPAKYDVVISFGSMCCGTADDDFLKDFITRFNKENKVTVDSWQMTGCGREGESKVLFSLANLKKAKRNRFIFSIKKLVPGQNEKNKAVKANSGNIDIAYDVLPGNITGCRGALAKYQLSGKK